MSAKDTVDDGVSGLNSETEDSEHLRETVRRSHRVRQMNVTSDIEGVRRERLVYLNKCKSGALSTVTAKRNEIERLMQDISNYDQVKSKSATLTRQLNAQVNLNKD